MTLIIFSKNKNKNLHVFLYFMWGQWMWRLIWGKRWRMEHDKRVVEGHQ
jgi:hypothetical protein